MKSPRRMVLVGIAAILGGFAPGFSRGQEPATPAPRTAPSPESSSTGHPKKEKYNHANDFLVIGTVFDAKGYAFPGARLKIRRGSEKKFRWGDYTNSRGDFAVRVPKGMQYEMVVHAKGFADQVREVDGKSGLGEARLVFRMEPAGGKKK